ncbi:uncharacterized protein MELLADRAFT_123551 [Melampsora larici-populina 98AG31]|uniref:Secreted protein n=1 Tax=Melampsora larici-populina (strain 98AG31 / pathotype 3-4-7) TaxID=747676 RepID=F4S4J6_MELLP|nr:uncharacterized protein MELLADRAFT_123551 [Melampsora larici-populina 98AG31]EGG00423.1 secreted protein [Melampsora larici-populina 98AG31]
MSWNRSTIIYQLFLAILLVAEFGSHIFVSANALDCKFGYHKTGYVYVCTPEDHATYICQHCGRADGLLPIGLDCVDEAGNQVGKENRGKWWTCDYELSPLKTTPRSDQRNTLCQHIIDNSGGRATYYCKAPGRYQQCTSCECTTCK